jgi:hypothetical protein
MVNANSNSSISDRRQVVKFVGNVESRSPDRSHRHSEGRGGEGRGI